MAALVRRRMTAMTISGPRGDAAWELNRQKTIDAFNVVKDVAVAANMKILFGTVPQMSEPCASIGDYKKIRVEASRTMDHNADSTMDQTTMDRTADSTMDRTTVTSDTSASTVHMELSVDPDEEEHVHMPTIVAVSECPSFHRERGRSHP
ncbi:unnamed protein product [Heligmosomoides polygyrus]|uniref:Fructose-bisphosphate aldolase n=1 Tax=Heligmosomoides polygyrus TaxID=6339 RepID=A0A183GMH1_HELPZ|nr:unnamed protein product [Heligmosomoides polygyrus]